ncbi:Egf [Columba guinea]|nr:Egf [Columba guinea]
MFLFVVAFLPVIFKIGFVSLSTLQHWNCPNGYRLKTENSACIDIDECLEGGLGTCGQTCVNVPGSYVCSCLPGYTLDIDKRSCYVNDPAPFLLFSHGNAIFRIDTEGTNHERLVADTGHSTLMDFHYTEEKVYWVDSERRLLQRMNLNGSKRERLSYIDKGISGFAIDWINQDILWANRQKATIEATDMNGKKRRVILRGVGHPMRITIDAEQRLLFWSSEGTVSNIHRVSLIGSIVRTLLRTTEKIKAISLDLVDTRLYWIQHDHRKEISHIGSCNYDGGAVRLLKNSVRKACLERSNLNGMHRKMIIWKDISQPRGIAIHPFAHCCSGLHSGKACVDLLRQMPSHLFEGSVSAHKEVVPKPTPETLPHSTQSGGIFKNIDSAEKEKMSILLMAEIMVSDQDDCTALECDVNAQCVLLEDGAMCQCLKGFTRKGKSCYDIDECKMGSHTCGENRTCTNTEGNFTCSCTDDASGTGIDCKATVSPAVVSNEYSTHPVQGDSAGCPPSYESYCLHGGVCNYVSDLQDYACNCVTGYVGERCQFSDLEWWEQQQVERVKMRNVTIAVCVAVLVLLLLLGFLAAYCHRSQNLYKKNLYAEAIRDASSRADNENVTPTSNKSRFAVVKECNSPLETKAVDLIGCETTDPHPACPSEYVEEQPIIYNKAAEALAEDEQEQSYRQEVLGGENLCQPTGAAKVPPQAPWSIYPKSPVERERCELGPSSLLMQPD